MEISLSLFTQCRKIALVAVGVISSVIAPVFAIPQGINQRNNKKEACQQKNDTPRKHQWFPIDNAFGDEQKGTDNKKNPAIQLIACCFVYNDFLFISVFFSCAKEMDRESPKLIPGNPCPFPPQELIPSFDLAYEIFKVRLIVKNENIRLELILGHVLLVSGQTLIIKPA